MIDVGVVVFWSVTSFALLTCSVLYLFAQVDTTILAHILLYGKAKLNLKHSSLSANIYKSCFWHFYVVGAAVNGCALYVSVRYYVHGTKVLPHSAYSYIFSKSATIDAASVVVVLTLYVAQTVRRLYECVCVSVYSRTQINILHYAMGITLYATFPVAIWSQAPAQPSTIESFSDFAQLRYVPGIALFVWASLQQYKCHVTLARMRKTKQGSVKDYGHYLPRGDWFNYVTCPHFCMEILIYTSLLLITGCRHTPMWSIYLFVFSNQVMAAMFSYEWYKKNCTNFDDRSFLSNVKAIFPYIL